MPTRTTTLLSSYSLSPIPSPLVSPSTPGAAASSSTLSLHHPHSQRHPRTPTEPLHPHPQPHPFSRSVSSHRPHPLTRIKSFTSWLSLSATHTLSSFPHISSSSSSSHPSRPTPNSKSSSTTSSTKTSPLRSLARPPPPTYRQLHRRSSCPTCLSRQRLDPLIGPAPRSCLRGRECKERRKTRVWSEGDAKAPFEGGPFEGKQERPPFKGEGETGRFEGEEEEMGRLKERIVGWRERRGMSGSGKRWDGGGTEKENQKEKQKDRDGEWEIWEWGMEREIETEVDRETEQRGAGVRGWEGV